jgi:hypothetical protein
MALLLDDMPGLEQVELDAPGDDRDAAISGKTSLRRRGDLAMAGNMAGAIHAPDFV